MKICIHFTLNLLCIAWTSQESGSSDPNSHSYMQSSVMSYSNTGQGAPKIYQATSATRQAPGGVSQVEYRYLLVHSFRCEYYFNFLSDINICNVLLIFAWHDIAFLCWKCHSLNTNQPLWVCSALFVNAIKSTFSGCMYTVSQIKTVPLLFLP